VRAVHSGRATLIAAACVLLALVMASASVADASSSRSLETIHPAGRASQRGIGPVRLNEQLAAVNLALGPGTLISRGTSFGYSYASYRYHSGQLTIEVDYGAANGAQTGPPVEADEISTSSPSATLYGRPLSAGLAAFSPTFRAHGWTVLSCRGETFTQLGPGGPGTGIAWRDGRLDYIQVDDGGSIGDQCEPLTPVSHSSSKAKSTPVLQRVALWILEAIIFFGVIRYRQSHARRRGVGSIDPSTGQVLPDKALIPELLRARRRRRTGHPDHHPPDDH
jgi:hypothetical protein